RVAMPAARPRSRSRGRAPARPPARPSRASRRRATRAWRTCVASAMGASAWAAGKPGPRHRGTARRAARRNSTYGLWALPAGGVTTQPPPQAATCRLPAAGEDMHTIPDQGAAPRRLPIYRHLYFQVVVAIVLGALLGHFEPSYPVQLKPLGDGFIKLVKMIIAPVIFLTIVTGIAGMTDLKAVGRVMLKAMAYFLTLSTLALLIGLLVAHVVQPGAGMNIDPAELDATEATRYAVQAHDLTLTGFLMDIIPDTVAGAFASGNILQVLLLAVLFGIALGLVGKPAEPALRFFEALTHPVFRVVGILMQAAPVG